MSSDNVLQPALTSHRVVKIYGADTYSRTIVPQYDVLFPLTLRGLQEALSICYAQFLISTRNAQFLISILSRLGLAKLSTTPRNAPQFQDVCEHESMAIIEREYDFLQAARGFTNNKQTISPRSTSSPTQQLFSRKRPFDRVAGSPRRVRTESRSIRD